MSVPVPMSPLLPSMPLLGMGTAATPPAVKQASSDDHGMGTAAFQFAPHDESRAAILRAIELGYRHFDTASLYGSERAVGEAVAEAVRSGLIASRADVFVTSKLWCSDAHADRVLPAMKETLKKLGMEYVDLYLVHFPASLRPGKYEFPFPKEEVVPFDMAAVWRGMEECHRLGLARAIGVSNFSCRKLEQLLSTAAIPPAVNQVEVNPVWQQRKLREFCRERGVQMSAYMPLGAVGSPWGSASVMDCDVLKDIAKAKGKTIAQICIRWVFEQGDCVLVKSYNEKRMQENLGFLGWELTGDEREKIGQIPQHRGHIMLEFVTEDGPYRSLDDLWDGEI